jgi:hypothetical protein
VAPLPVRPLFSRSHFSKGPVISVPLLKIPAIGVVFAVVPIVVVPVITVIDPVAVLVISVIFFLASIALRVARGVHCRWRSKNRTKNERSDKELISSVHVSSSWLKFHPGTRGRVSMEESPSRRCPISDTLAPICFYSALRSSSEGRLCPDRLCPC